MKKGTFIFDGVSSEDLNTLIQSRPSIEAPLRKVEMKSIYGSDGDMPIDEGAYSNTTLELSMFTNGNDLIGDRQKLYDVLDSRGVYKELIPYFDPDKIYRVMLSDKVKFDNQEMFGNIQLVTANFSVMPYKYLLANTPVQFINSLNINNPTNYHSQPIIEVTGTGSVVIKVNGVDFVIKNVPGTIVVNSERYAAYQENVPGVLTPMNHQIATREFPVLKPGANQITVTGSVTNVTIKPRWRSLV